jgi:hypothetical protein
MVAAELKLDSGGAEIGGHAPERNPKPLGALGERRAPRIASLTMESSRA